MTKDEIKKKIIEEIYEIAPEHEGETIPENENIQRSLEIDSFDFLNLLTALNDELGVEVPESDYGEVDTVEHMADYFVKHLSK
ncbi:acyl carrier protein [Sulfurovum sp. NBC37-1]|uniref:acyl carrier protein n=1 Tax=Sulfurovum sp. (strain NBC37-1) TaxID=387093 RepID=UPI000158772D|nr:phosphopantetheine-binding protein [Sulfurovum sp. NBC37-1]BAF71926.1 acyl carrier protein ACP [Sulfurovum sp. NBC37-1]